jgi:hypothetical protein
MKRAYGLIRYSRSLHDVCCSRSQHAGHGRRYSAFIVVAAFSVHGINIAAVPGLPHFPLRPWLLAAGELGWQMLARLRIEK